jgi:hypothetical protein
VRAPSLSDFFADLLRPVHFGWVATATWSLFEIQVESRLPETEAPTAPTALTFVSFLRLEAEALPLAVVGLILTKRTGFDFRNFIGRLVWSKLQGSAAHSYSSS